jgi:hypothetical protein
MYDVSLLPALFPKWTSLEKIHWLALANSKGALGFLVLHVDRVCSPLIFSNLKIFFLFTFCLKLSALRLWSPWLASKIHNHCPIESWQKEEQTWHPCFNKKLSKRL